MKYCFLLLVASALFYFVLAKDDQIDALFKLNKLKDLGLISEAEYKTTKNELIQSYLGLNTNQRRISSLSHNNTVTITPQVSWLLRQFVLGMPRSYDDTVPYTGDSFWHTKKYITKGAFSPFGDQLAFDDQIAIQERALTHAGLNLYDGGVWSIALALSGCSQYVDMYNRGVLYPSSTGANPQVDGLISIRANKPEYFYGPDQVPGPSLEKITLAGNMTQVSNSDPTCCGLCCEQVSTHEIPGSYYYRMIGPTYRMLDPLGGNYGWTWKAPPAGPNNDTSTKWNLAGIIHWNDWKPITGENVWGAILAPLQVMWIKNCTNITKFSTFKEAPGEVQLALSVVPALKALKSPLGSMYHCPKGTEMFPADPSEETNVSNENNFSAYASFKVFKYILDTFAQGSSDPVISSASTLLDDLIKGLDAWFGKYLLSTKPIDGEYVVYQGGHVTFDGVFLPQDGPQAFAVDCQTWGLTVVGQKVFDGAYGDGQAMKVWRATKSLAGYYVGGELAGVGYTVSVENGTTNNTGKNKIWSGEWSWGAVNLCRKLAKEYRAVGRDDFADELESDMKSMISLMSKPMVPCEDGTWCGGGLVQVDGSYLYANDRFFIPWGWYANPIGATSSTAWAVMNDYLYNPFELGGGPNSIWIDKVCNSTAPYSLHAARYFGWI
eukprot:TRINITY_DN141_c0_g2_i2.p1 TRINITY_DN141_c0_g2~~TRINITY_DN141_c0_g2_i2.p1  ORF type:complete len:663 (-),score=169.39 TRINITY_DN141_c0_g2_i2:41-2029(-)